MAEDERQPWEAEVDAMRAIVKALEPLQHASRRRVMLYVGAYFGLWELVTISSAASDDGRPF